MSDLVLSPGKSRVVVHTFAEGLFARLAHDLELVLGGLAGTASRDASGASTATVRAPISAITVAGVLKNGRVDDSVLSAGDRHDILDKMRRDVFHASESAELIVEATLERGDARLRLVPPNGRAVEVTTRPTVRDEAGGARVTGSFDVSLAALGSDPIKGPMGAFRMKDRVAVRFEIVFET